MTQKELMALIDRYASAEAAAAEAYERLSSSFHHHADAARAARVALVAELDKLYTVTITRIIEVSVDAALGEVARQQGGIADQIGREARNVGLGAANILYRPRFHDVDPTILEDGGKPGSRETGNHATQQGAATPGYRRSDQVAHDRADLHVAVGNVAEPQIGPTPDRVDHPPSSGTFSAVRNVPDPKECTPRAHAWKTGSAVCICGKATRTRSLAGWKVARREPGPPILGDRPAPSDYVCTKCGEPMARWDQFEEYQHETCGGLVELSAGVFTEDGGCEP
jgi:hypothetical protein